MCCLRAAIFTPSIRAPCPPALPSCSPRRRPQELLRRHLQDHGDWPRALVIDVWGSATMRTGGEDLALALLLDGRAARLGSRLCPRHGHRDFAAAPSSIIRAST